MGLATFAGLIGIAIAVEAAHAMNGIPTASADRDAAGDLLKSRGLVRFGNDTAFNLKAENDLIRRIKEIQPVQKALLVTTREHQTGENRLGELQRQRKQFLEKRISLNRDLQRAQSTAENNQIVAAINEASDRVNLIDAEIKSTDEQMERRRDGLAKARSDYLRVTSELRGIVVSTEKKYLQLTLDAEVQSALKQFQGDDDKEYRIAPSRAYLAAVKQLEKSESAISSDNIALEQRNGVYRVEVEINGTQKVSMVFDTGAGYVTLPARLANELGIRPGDQDANVTVIIADGSRVQAKAMRLKSMRVGKCVAEDVDCIVMPESLPNAPMVLGGTFLKNFTYKIDPQTHRLTLSKIDTGPPPRENAASKKSRTTKGKTGGRP